jgi:hypothetical protein
LLLPAKCRGLLGNAPKTGKKPGMSMASTNKLGKNHAHWPHWTRRVRQKRGCRCLAADFGFTRVRFSAPLKNMLRTLLRDMGYCEDDVERHIEGDLKETEIPELGVTPRHLMVTLGHGVGPGCGPPGPLGALWAARAGQPRVVVEDVRFPNEVELIRARGGVLWRIDRPGLTAGRHVSEQLEVRPDLTIEQPARSGFEGLRGHRRAGWSDDGA